MISAGVTVVGMTCGHCAASVRKEIGRISGVTRVDVDLETGRVTIDRDGDVDLGAVARAVEEAGYRMAAGDPG